MGGEYDQTVSGEGVRLGGGDGNEESGVEGGGAADWKRGVVVSVCQKLSCVRGGCGLPRLRSTGTWSRVCGRALKKLPCTSLLRAVLDGTTK